MFSEQQPVLGGAAIAERLGVARSTAYRYLQSLVRERFLEEAPHGGYRLGLRVLEVARVARRSYGLSEVAVPVMTYLSEWTGETVLLTRRAGDLVVCLERVETGSGHVRVSYERGSTLPINAGASALALLAWSPQDEVRKILESADLRSFTTATLTDTESLMARMAQIRGNGYSITRAELDPDVVGIAAPISDEEGRVVASVSVAALASRVRMSSEKEIVSRVLDAATEISERLSVLAG